MASGEETGNQQPPRPRAEPEKVRVAGEERHEHWATLLIPVALIVGLVIILGLETDSTSPEVGMASPFEPWLKWLVGYLAAAAESVAAVVIGLAIGQGFVGFLRQFIAPAPPYLGGGETIRLRLGRGLALGLEFTVASDILRTAVAPTRQDILILAAIVLLRSLLNYFLEREIRQVEARRPSAPPPASGVVEGE